MSTFAEKLAGKLPSQVATEATDDIDALISELATTDECGEPAMEGDDDIDDAALDASDIGDDDADDIGDDDFDPDDLSDEELAKLDAELSGDAVAAAAGISDDDDDDGKHEVTLTPSEELQADDMMAVAATTMLVNDELNAEERAEFISSGEAMYAVREGFMTEADVNEIATEAGLVTESKYTNKMIVRLNAEAKKKQLRALAVSISAAAHNDRDYLKARKLRRMYKLIRAKLDRKYDKEATKRMRIYFARLQKSRSGKLAAIAKKNV